MLFVMNSNRFEQNGTFQHIQELTSTDFALAAGSVLLFLPFEWSMGIIFVILAMNIRNGKLREAAAKLPGGIWLYSFAGLQLLSSILSNNPIGVINALGTIAIALLIALYAQSVTPSNLRLAMKTTGALSGVTAICGIQEFIHLARINNAPVLECLQTLPEFTRIRSTCYNPNLYAAMIVFHLIICLYLLFTSENWKARAGWSAVLLFNLIALLLTGSRMAMAAVPFLLPVFFWFAKKKKPFWTTVGLEGGAGIMLLIHPQIIPRFGFTASVSERFLIWKGAIEGISKNWLIGGGPQYYSVISRRMMTPKAPHAHSLLLDLLLNSGLLGTAFILLFVKDAMRLAWNEKVDERMPYLRAALLCAVGAVLLEGLADCTINFPAPAIFVLSVLSAPAAWMQTEQQKDLLSIPVPTWSVPAAYSNAEAIPVLMHSAFSTPVSVPVRTAASASRQIGRTPTS